MWPLACCCPAAHTRFVPLCEWCLKNSWFCNRCSSEGCCWKLSLRSCLKPLVLGPLHLPVCILHWVRLEPSRSVHALPNAHCQVSYQAPSRGHSCPILMMDNDLTVFNQLINGPDFSWWDTLQLPKEDFFVGGESTVHRILVLFNLPSTCTTPLHFHSVEQICPCPAGKQDLQISIKNIEKIIII